MSMDREHSRRDAMKRVRIVEALVRVWDPIGVEPDKNAPADEYDSYAPHIVSMVANGCSSEELAAHLRQPASENMGLSPRPAADIESAEAIMLALQRESA